MTQGFYQSNAGAGFREYLTSSMSDMFSLDLSRCTLIECIHKMCEIKSRSPEDQAELRMLVNKLEDIERQFGCTIMPAMISSVFWNHFVPFLQTRDWSIPPSDMWRPTWLPCWTGRRSRRETWIRVTEVDIPNYIPSKISLTPDEIATSITSRLVKEPTYSFRSKKVLKLRRNKIETLERVRDMFVLGCNLGQRRYSDLVRISPENFRNGQFSSSSRRRATSAFVPINSLSIDSRITFAIWRSTTTMRHIRATSTTTTRICMNCCTISARTSWRGSHWQQDNGSSPARRNLRYQLISRTVPRRSFATINTLRNIPRTRYCEHRAFSEKAFVRYICYDEES